MFICVFEECKEFKVGAGDFIEKVEKKKILLFQGGRWFYVNELLFNCFLLILKLLNNKIISEIL